MGERRGEKVEEKQRSRRRSEHTGATAPRAVDNIA